jgi:hypothetical protein
MGKLSSKTPSLYLPKGVNKASVRTGSIDHAKDCGISFSGYGLAEGESIVFYTAEEMAAVTNKKTGDCDYIIFFKTEGARNETMLVLVKDANTGRQRWFNMNTCVREAREADGTRIDIDDFRKEMRSMSDHGERLRALYGATLVGSGIEDLYTQDFGDDRKPIKDSFSPYKFVQIECHYADDIEDAEVIEEN